MLGKKKMFVKVIAPATLTAALLAGCAVVQPDELVTMINAGDTVVLEINEPTAYEVSNMSVSTIESVLWGQLDQLETFEDMRTEFDKTFNINTIQIGDTTSKQGCVYVVREAGKEVRSGNTTLADAFRNKAFVEKYWGNSEVTAKLAELADMAYADIDDSDYASQAVLNAYFNLLGDDDESNFNATQSVSREQFYTMLFKANNSYRDIKYSPIGDSFTSAVGGQTEYTKYAKEVAKYGFLQADNKSLDETNIGTSISRAEAVYMIVNYSFQSKLNQVSDNAEAFSDTANGGDIALEVGFKEKGKDGTITPKDRWQSYTLAYMLKHPDKGMQTELYKAMVVAKELNLIDGDSSRWDETISRSEAIDILVRVQLAKNSLEGYLTEGEYAEGVASNDSIANEALKSQISEEMGNAIKDGADQLKSTLPLPAIAYEELTAEQLKIFDDIIAPYPDKIKADKITPEEAEKEQLAKVDEYIQSRQLPSNAKELFTQHKEKTNYADKIKKPDTTPTPAPQETENNNGGGGGGNDWGGSGNNAPQPSGGGNSGGNSGGNGGGNNDYGYDPGSIGTGGWTGTTPSGIPGGANVNDFSNGGGIEGMGEW